MMMMTMMDDFFVVVRDAKKDQMSKVSPVPIVVRKRWRQRALVGVLLRVLICLFPMARVGGQDWSAP
jgi:hypothetical protein